MEAMTFKEESQAMFEVFMEALALKFPDNQLSFCLIAMKVGKEDEEGECAIQVNGSTEMVSIGVHELFSVIPDIQTNLLSLKIAEMFNK